MVQDILKECYERAIDVIKQCSTPHGLYASGGREGYNAVWSRDSMISMISASVADVPGFQEVFKNSIITLAEHQGKTGQIPNCVDIWEERKPHVDFQTIDSSLWFIIGNHVYKDRYEDDSLLIKYKSNIDKAMNWLSCQDIGEVGMLGQLPTSDWQDAFPHRYGYTINTQALYYKALSQMWKEDTALSLKNTINTPGDNSLWNGKYYYPYRWKNHNKYKEIGPWFDSFGNFLAIVFDLADKDKASKIISHVKKNKIDSPVACRAIYPPIKKGDHDWQDYYLDCAAGTPNQYLNGGIWTFIGNFYVLSLIKNNKMKDAKEALMKIAKRDLDGNFPEWTHPITKKHFGHTQAWEAGTYILAYQSLDQEKCLL